MGTFHLTVFHCALPRVGPRVGEVCFYLLCSEAKVQQPLCNSFSHYSQLTLLDLVQFVLKVMQEWNTT